MWITNADRDVKVLYYEPEEQQLRTMPNIRDGKIKEIVLYLDDIMLADYDRVADAVQEMEKIMKAYQDDQEEYQVKDYELTESDLELVKHLRHYFVNNAEFDEMLEDWE